MDLETQKLFVSEFKKRAEAFHLTYSVVELEKLASERLPLLMHIEPLYFTKDTEDFVASAAAKNLAQIVYETGDWNAAWSSLEKSFRDNNYWAFPTVNEKPKSGRINSVKELRSYITTFIMSMVIMKAVIYYYGLKSSSEEGSGANTFILLAALAFSFCSLVFFAWKKSRKR
jgi:hypothetical protein